MIKEKDADITVIKKKDKGVLLLESQSILSRALNPIASV